MSQRPTYPNVTAEDVKKKSSNIEAEISKEVFWEWLHKCGGDIQQMALALKVTESAISLRARQLGL